MRPRFESRSDGLGTVQALAFGARHHCRKLFRGESNGYDLRGCRSRVDEPRVVWVLDTDVRSANHLQPVFSDRMLVPPWLQVRGCVVEVQRGGEPTCLRDTVEHSLASVTDRAFGEPLVEVTPIGRRRWQVSFPDDVHERLGARYAELEDVLRAVEGVAVATMEDRDQAIVSTRHDMDAADLQHQLNQVVEALTST